MPILRIMKSGPEQLRDWMERRGFNQRETADHFGWTESYVSLLLRFERSPGLPNAMAIERETGIPAEAWLAEASSGLDKAAVGVASDRSKRNVTKR